MRRPLFIVACVACIARHASAQDDAARRPESARPADAHANDSADEPPVIPVGLDAYRQWERWPYQRIGARAYMRSTYDRSGGNEGADASHFLYQTGRRLQRHARRRRAGRPLLCPLQPLARQPVALRGGRRRSHRPGDQHGGRRPSPRAGSVFLPAEAFPNPLAWTWSVTRGADLTWVPIPFEQSFRMAYSRTHYGTGYYIYHQYVRGRAALAARSGLGRRDAAGCRCRSIDRPRGTDLAAAGRARRK